MKSENHVYSAAYREDEIDEILENCDHVVFNSFSQWKKYKDKAIKAGKSYGLRINPEFSTQIDHEIYDPCAPFSRLGITKSNFLREQLDGISGLHFHTLCEQNSDDLLKTIKAVEENFGKYFKDIKWINLGGGHHITRSDYDTETLIKIIRELQDKYQLEVYLEPGEAIALNAGFLISRVLDIVENGMDICIIDASAACHMPDVLEMPYRPYITDSGLAKEKSFTYRFGGPTCLSGDIIGDYSFDKPKMVGDIIEFCDMAIYTMVKNNTFNGINLPSIVIKRGDEYILHKSFSYDDFKNRLG